MNEQQWQIKIRATGCQQCGHVFQDQEAYFSQLVADTNDYARFDYCANCWEQSTAKEKVISNWRGMFRLPLPPPPEPLKKEYAEQLLRQMLANPDPAMRNAIYILALLLERKRVIAEKEVLRQPAEQVVRVYEHRRTGEVFLIPDPCLAVSDIGKVQTEVASLFKLP